MISKRLSAFRPQRYLVNENYIVRVSVERACGEAAETVDARLIDLACGGAKLSLAAPLKLQESLRLALHSEELAMHFAIAAQVCWIRQATEGNWFLGCSFSPPLPERSLDKLFSMGLLERRRNKRRSVRGQNSAVFDNSPDETPVTVLDLSPGGFSILSSLPAEIGVGMRLTLDAGEPGQGAQVPAAVQWRMQVEGGYVLGCGLTNQSSYGLLLQSLCPDERPPLLDRPRQAVTWLSLAGLAAAIGWYCLTVLRF